MKKSTFASLAPALVAIIFSSKTFSAEPARYTYRDPIFPKKSLVINLSEKAFHIGGVALPMTVCKNDDSYLCVESDGFNFHIPKKDHSRTAWQINGISYKADDERIAILGNNFSVRRINGKGKNLHIIYMFSSENGLIGFSFVDEKTGAKGTYLLDQNCGFGAKMECRENR